MKTYLPFLMVTTLSLLGSCAQLPKTVEPYKPEFKKEVTFSFHAKDFSEQKKGLQISIIKAPLHSLKFKAPVCTVAAPVVETTAKAPAKPKSAFGSLLSFAVKAAKSTPAEPKKDFGVTPKTEEIVTYSALPTGYYAFKVTLKNSTNHIIELNRDNDPNPYSPLIRLVGPKGKVQLPLSEKSVLQNWMTENCYNGESTSKAQDIYSSRKSLVGAEIFPGETIVKYLYFKPDSVNVPGIWKLSLWEVPVMTDSAGRANETDHFHTTAEVKKWETTFKRSEEDGPFKKVKEVQVYK